jgi:CelD/BcsL family acetyltransferase involved in cellulose biosynthesis
MTGSMVVGESDSLAPSDDGRADDAPDPAEDASPVLRAERVPPAQWGSIDDWDDAVAASAFPSVFLTRDWVTAWWTSFGAGLEPVLMRVRERGGRTVGLAPLYLERPALGRPIGLRRLGIIGDRVVGSEYLGLVARAGQEAAVASAVAARLRHEARWDVAELKGLVAGDPAGEALEAALGRSAGFRRVTRQACSMIHLPDDWDSYLSTLGPRFRRRKRTDGLRRAFPAARIFLTDEDSLLKPHLARLWEIHQSHWTGVGYTGSFADPRMRAFYLDVSRRFLAAGRLRFWQLEIDGVIRASQYGFVHHGVLHALQDGYDTSFRAPGLDGLGVVLRTEVLRRAIETERLRGYDFLGGVEEFKTRWGTSTHYTRTIQIAARGIRGRLAWLATVGARDLYTRVVAVMPVRLLKALRAVRGRRRSART